MDETVHQRRPTPPYKLYTARRLRPLQADRNTIVCTSQGRGRGRGLRRHLKYIIESKNHKMLKAGLEATHGAVMAERSTRGLAA